jgi:VanZ family protein
MFSSRVIPSLSGTSVIPSLSGTSIIPPYQAAITAFSISLGYAVFDEIHQYFIPGRACEIGDILVDAAGAGVASILGWLTGLPETKK